MSAKFNSTIEDSFDEMLWHGIAESKGRGLSREIVSLWRKVILQALIDFSTPSYNTDRLRHKFSAERWLLHNNSDFKIVCEMADINSCMLRNMIKTQNIDNIYQRTKVAKT